MGSALMTMADQAQSAFKAGGNKDLRLFRTFLLVEEVGELLVELSTRNNEKALKEMADVLYVVYGMAVTFDLPLGAAFDNVHESNMTKSSSAALKDGDKGKGQQYKKADMCAVIKAFRDNQQSGIRI